MRKIPIIAGEIYHICNRGVDKRKIFIDEEDYYRFIHDLFEFNDENSALNVNYFFKKPAQQSMDTRRPYIGPRKILAEILAFSLMPNHYHLLIKPKTDTGGAELMKKINGGYARYFNNKYQRAGALFQGRYKAVLIENESHFIHIPYYIHANPLDMIAPEWRNGKITNFKTAIDFLENYRWSSFLDYMGKKNFPSVTQRDLLLNISGEGFEYKKHFINWLRHMDMKNFDDLTLESQSMDTRRP